MPDKMTHRELIRNLGVVSYLSYQVLHTYERNGNVFPSQYYEDAKAGHKWAGHDVRTLREALIQAKERDDYYISDLVPAAKHDYSDVEIKSFFDLFLGFLDECLGPMED